VEACVKNHRLKEAQVHAFPQPFSPFNWKTVVSHDDYEIASGNLGRTRELEVSAAQSDLSGWWEAIVGFSACFNSKMETPLVFGLCREGPQNPGVSQRPWVLRKR